MGVFADIHNDLEKGAFQLLVEYRGRLYGEAVRLCHDMTQAEDLVFRTIEKVLSTPGGFQDGTNLFGWMKTIMTNLHRNDMKRPVVRGTKAVEEEGLERYAGVDWKTDEDILKRSDGEAVRAALAELDPEYRQIVLLRYYDDLSLKEIAAFLNKPVGTIGRRIHVALHLLAGKLSAELDKGKKPLAVLGALLLGTLALFGAHEFGLFDGLHTQEKPKMKLTSPLVAIGATLVAGGNVSSTQAATFSSRAYVQKGLIYQLDGIRNVGHFDEHDDSVTVWKNLAGEGEVTLTCTAPDWGDGTYFYFKKSAKTTSCGNGTCNALRNALANKHATAEWAFNWPTANTKVGWLFAQETTATTGRFFDLNGENGYTTIRVCGGAVSPGPVTVPAGNSHTLSVQAADIVRIYTNGVLDVACTKTSYGNSTLGTQNFRLGEGILQENMAHLKLYAMRFYDRALTEDEIALNANVDAVRFMGGTPAGKILTVTTEPAELGVATPVCGTAFTDGGVKQFSLPFETQAYDDGVTAVPYGDGGRCRYLGYSIAEDGDRPVMHDTAAMSFSHNVASNETIVSWVFTPQYLLQVSGRSGVTVSVDGSEPAQSVSLWCDAESAHTLEMTVAGSPDRYLWGGETKSEIVDRTQRTTTIVVREATALVASGVSYPAYESELSAAQSAETRVKTTSESEETLAGSRAQGMSLLVK